MDDVMAYVIKLFYQTRYGTEPIHTQFFAKLSELSWKALPIYIFQQELVVTLKSLPF